MSLLIPVSDSMKGGIGISGLTSVLHSRTYSPCATSIKPISVMRSRRAVAPVVSRSRKTSGRSSMWIMPASAFAGGLLIRWFVADATTRRYQSAEFEQPSAQAIGAGFDTVDHAIADHYVQYAVRGRRMEPGLLREQLEIDRRGMRRQRVEQAHHAVYDLNR